MVDDSSPDGNPVTPPDNGEQGPPGDRTRLDRLYRSLASTRRRLLLSHLTTRSGEPVSVEELVDVVVEREQPDPGLASHRERVVTDIHHVHLPRLADVGVIDYDPVDGTVLYEASERVESLLAASDVDVERTE